MSDAIRDRNFMCKDKSSGKIRVMNYFESIGVGGGVRDLVSV
jgi:hypothetical protein